MNLYDQVKTYLENEPRFREREAKNRGIADLIIKKYNLDIDRRMLADILAEANSMDRAWRKCLEEDETLRGNDYNEKTILETKKQIELGYTPHYHEDVKQLNLI